MSKSEGSGQRSRSPWQLVGLGTEIAASVVMMAGAGYLLDRWLGSWPWLLIVGAFLGMVIGFYNLVRRVRNIQAPS